MSSILLDARGALEAGGYRTLIPQPDATLLLFEDATVLGVLHVLETVQHIFSGWQGLQDLFLREHGPRLVADPFKAWNCYTVLITPEFADKSQSSALFGIEEDFRATRKIVRAGVSTRLEIEAALSPLLPLKRVLALQIEDVKKRLGDRLGGPGSPLYALLSATEPARIAAALVGNQ